MTQTTKGTINMPPHSISTRIVRAAALAAALASVACAAADRPNLVWVMADDLGWGDLGSYGQKVIRTPRLDAMAREGLRFTHFYAGATVCAPSRSVLMTGLHHGHTRVRGNAGKTNPTAQALRAEDVTVARCLQQAGYTTALIGKWGLGDVGEADSGLPRRHGFDRFFGFLNQHHAHNHFPDHLWRGEEKVLLPNVVTPFGEYGGGYTQDGILFADDLMTDEVLKFVSHHQDKPFFLYWSPVIPHANNERTRAIGNGAQPPDLGPYAGTDWPDPDKGQAAFITRLDSYVGRLLDHLRILGIETSSSTGSSTSAASARPPSSRVVGRASVTVIRRPRSPCTTFRMTPLRPTTSPPNTPTSPQRSMRG